MKTKKKVLALLEIAVVLCSLFLVSLPAIAADQNQAMQKVSANEVTTASEDDSLPLGIYGNANEDDTIDMGDVVYTKLAIFGKKPKTELCDAKYDGRINIQTKLIILGKEKELTVIDHFGDPVTIRKPVERIIVIRSEGAEVLRVLVDATDKIVGVATGMGKDKLYFPELSELPSIGGWMRPGLNYEAILNLNPDVLITTARAPSFTGIDKEKLPGIAVIWPDIDSPERFKYGVRRLGYIIDKEEEADKYINWHEGWKNTIKERTEGLPKDKKLRVLYLWHFEPGGDLITISKASRIHAMCCVIAGGKSISEDLIGTWPRVDPEWVIVQNPDIIVVQARVVAGGYGVDDASEMAAMRADFMNRPEFARVAAVEKGNVYVLRGDLSNGPRCLAGSAYMAKWFYPELFKDLEPKAIHQEYLTRFCGLDIDLDEKGVFVYHPVEHPDGH